MNVLKPGSIAVSCEAERGVGTAAGDTDAAASGLTDAEGDGAAGLGTALTAGDAATLADTTGTAVGGGAVVAAGALVGVGGACEHPATAAASTPAMLRATNRWLDVRKRVFLLMVWIAPRGLCSHASCRRAR
jgi:hypothetical protein